MVYRLETGSAGRAGPIARASTTHSAKAARKKDASLGTKKRTDMSAQVWPLQDLEDQDPAEQHKRIQTLRATHREPAL